MNLQINAESISWAKLDAIIMYCLTGDGITEDCSTQPDVDCSEGGSAPEIGGSIAIWMERKI